MIGMFERIAQLSAGMGPWAGVGDFQASDTAMSVMREAQDSSKRVPTKTSGR